MKRVMMLVALDLMLLGFPLLIPAPVAAQSCEQCLGGWLDAPVKIEVFSDFECPACRVFFLDTVKYVLVDYANIDKVCVIYREFPLAIHKYSHDAARYSLAAQKLGRQQWLSVVESMYTNQEVWAKDGSVQAFVARALSPEDFQRVLKLKDDPSIEQTIARDIALGQKREVQSTPTFFITYLNKEQKVVGGLPYPVLRQFFDKIVK
ncbi:MAG TPA: thioredoxin domain-containing protein [Acidobacteriota bacterium]|nr:thioredoxin domain-containing protein [Acidobacteriota bacterium]